MNTNIKVNFVIAGVQKGGTTTLYQYLKEHQDIFMGSKGPHYFDNEANFYGITDYSKYHSLFSNAPKGIKLFGDATPIYTYWSEAPKRIWNYNQKMKFIIVLRNPIERAYSQWNMQRSKGNENLSFWEAITTEETRSRSDLPLQCKRFSYIDRGFYTEQLRRIWRFFPREQTLIMKSQELNNSHNDVLSKVSDFLDIENFRKVDNKVANSRTYESGMSEREHAYLKEIFYYEIKALENILNWDCSDWLL